MAETNCVVRQKIYGFSKMERFSQSEQVVKNKQRTSNLDESETDVGEQLE